MEPSISVCVGNEGLYAEGFLVDEWIDLPVTNERLQEFLYEKIRIGQPNGCGSVYEEHYVSDFDGHPFGKNCQNLLENASLYDLNLLAKQMQIHPNACNIVRAALDTGCDTPESLNGLMNWIEQAGEIPFCAYNYSGIDVKDQWGETTLERLSANASYGYTLLENYDTDLLETLNAIPEALAAFDVEAYGEACAMNRNVKLGEKGYLDFELDDMPDENYYSSAALKEMIESEWDKKFGLGKGIGNIVEQGLEAFRKYEPAVAEDKGMER